MSVFKKDDGHDHKDHHHYPCVAEGYEMYEEIGAGAFASVFRAVTKETGEEVAIKVIDLDQFNTNWEEIRREILVMSLLHHPNVVRIHCSFVVGQDLWIVMPLLEAGSCAAIMKTQFANGFKDEVLIATILKEILQGLEYFHKDNRIHRDVKAGNILVGKDGCIQLADFGVAATLVDGGDRRKGANTFTGTPCWMAPEVMEQSKGYDEKADIWSFGITAMELAFGRAPYQKYQPMKVILLTLQEEPPTCEIYNDNSYEFSKSFKSMISKCLRKDVKRRSSCKKLLEHKFFRQARDKEYIVEHLVKKLPPRPRGPKQTRESISPAAHRLPVSVGSWVFDQKELAEMKKQAAESKQTQLESREKSVQESYDDSSSDNDEHSQQSRRAPPPAVNVVVPSTSKSPSQLTDSPTSSPSITPRPDQMSAAAAYNQMLNSLTNDQ